jgi:hypothetical protein
MKIAFPYDLNNVHCIVTNGIRAGGEGKVALFEKCFGRITALQFFKVRIFIGSMLKNRLFPVENGAVLKYTVPSIYSARSGEAIGD